MNILPPCSSCAPKLLPSYPTSDKAKLAEALSGLLATIEILEKHEKEPTIYKLLENIIWTYLYSGEPKILDLGWECAIDRYGCATQNRVYEETLIDPKNPVNWQGYQQWKESQVSPNDD